MEASLDSECPQFQEMDPTGRYCRYEEILGRGASKTVYRGFDEYDGIEVAWNQVKLNDFLQRPDDLERLYCEIHLLKTLKHKNIMKFYSSWVDTSKLKINFVTEMFTSGTLRQYRQKHRRVNVRALKLWCRQILSGLLYLHSHDPPIIHRDLKCDNIFVNGNQGEVKIGDLGLAAILRKPLAGHCVGTPEFMAPEMYEEAYNELVDIYSFGMCVLEMVTFEYPYSECSHPAQIYKKVISGRKPDAFFKIMDPEVKLFVEKCLAIVSERLSARELLNDPFLQISVLFPHIGEQTIAAGQVLGPSSYRHLTDEEVFITYRLPSEITIKGMRSDDGDIFLMIRISDTEGNVRNIYFPFNLLNDTAFGVAAEMVAELNISDHNATQIAEIINGEVASMAPEWQPDMNIKNSHRFSPMMSFSGKQEPDASSTHSALSFLSMVSESSNSTSTSHLECAIHGRFGEIACHKTADKTQCHEIGALSTSISSLELPSKRSLFNVMKSFQFGINFSYLITSIVKNDASKAKSNKKCIKHGNIKSEGMFEERSLSSPGTFFASKTFQWIP